MFALLRPLLVALFRVPDGPPEPPRGHAGPDVEVFQASPRYLAYRLLAFGLGAAIALLAVGAGLLAALANGEEEAAFAAVLVGVFVVIVAGLVYVTVRIDYELRYYVVTDRSLRVREGAWVCRERTLTFANVQNLRVRQGPLQRLFSIWTLELETAGGGAASSAEARAGRATGHQVSVVGVEDAHALRDRILAHLRARPGDSGLGDPDDRGAARAGLSGRALEALRDVQVAARELATASRGRVG